MTMFILVQIFGAIALIFSTIAYFCNNKKNFLLITLLSSCFYATSYLFAGSLIAGINTLISISRTLLIFYYEKNEKVLPMYFVLLYSVVYLGVGTVFLRSAIDIIPLITPIMFMCAIRIRNLRYVRWLSLLPNMLLIAYGLVYKTYTNAILDTFDCVVLTVAIVICEINIKKLKETKSERQVFEKPVKK